MRHVYLHDEQARQDFAAKAARHFAAHPEHWSYSDCVPEPIMPGALLALRWGLGDDCVLVLRVGDEVPTIYGNLIREQAP